MSDDLTGIMNAWPYDSDQTVRIVIADDGRSILQVRLPLGIEQYEMSGRPDGLQPFGYESYVIYLEDRLRQHIIDHGSDLGFFLTEEEGRQLQAEGILFYYRYLILFQMRNFSLVTRDCDHNLALCDLLERYCENEDIRNGTLQFQPYIIRMRAAAEALGVESGEGTGNIQAIIDDAVHRINELAEIDTPAFQFERIRSVNYLRSMAKRLGSTGQTQEGAQSDGRTDLELALQRAVEQEDYERAAELRDRIRQTGRVDEQ